MRRDTSRDLDSGGSYSLKISMMILADAVVTGLIVLITVSPEWFL